MLTVHVPAGAIPTALVGTVQNAGGLIALRCFIGILGGSFVPCQVWTTGFFDKNVVGTANALAAGLGNAGSGVAYFLMPAIFDSLVQHQGLTPHTAWRVTFLAPFIMMAVSAVFIIVACPDTPTGKWSSRAYDLQRQNEHRDMYVSPFDSQNSISGPRKQGGKGRKRAYSDQTVELDKTSWNDSTTDQSRSRGAVFDEQDVLNAASWELVEKPTYHGYIEALFSPSTLTLVVAYFCTFGTELAVNAFLGAYYFQHFPSLGQTGSDQRAAMYGLLNAVFRPAGGLISDFLYRVTGSLWAKKLLMHTLVVAMGAVMVVVGFLDPRDKGMMVGLMAVLAFFEEAGNGAVFALLPHVQPTFNGMFYWVISFVEALGMGKWLTVALTRCRAYDGCHGCGGGPWRYRFPFGREVPGRGLCEGVLGCGGCEYWIELVGCVDSAGAEGTGTCAVKSWGGGGEERCFLQQCGLLLTTSFLECVFFF